MKMDDIAKELGISTTTVSRVISGKGRVSVQTQQRVQRYIEENNYRPNLIARSLAQSKTYNIAVVLQKAYKFSMPYFQTVLNGICDAASYYDYDVIVIWDEENDITRMKRVVQNQKVDGVILTRTYPEDVHVAFMKESGIPFVVIGSVEEEGVIQVDVDHVTACEELTRFLLAMGNRRLAYLSGGRRQMVDWARYEGFCRAHRDTGIQMHEELMFTTVTLDNQENFGRVIDKVLANGADCLVCVDDFFGECTLNYLKEKGVAVPDEIKLACFNDNETLDRANPSVTAIHVDVGYMGRVAMDRLMNLMNDEDVAPKTIIDYEILMKRSTGKNSSESSYLGNAGII